MLYSNSWFFKNSFKGFAMDNMDQKDSLQAIHFNDIIDTQHLDFGSALSELPYEDSDGRFACASILNCAKKKIQQVSSLKNQTLVYVSFSGFEIVERQVGHLGAELLFVSIIDKLKGFLGTTAKLYNPMLGYGLIFVVPETSESRLKKNLIQIVSLLSAPQYINREVHSISARVGVFAVANQMISFKQAVRNARCALPFHDGHIAFYSNDIETHDQDRFFLQDKIEHAIDNNEFDLVYQCVHNIENGKIVGVEALLRWCDFLNDHIAPNEFMPIANRSARVKEINLCVIQKALSDYKSWIRKGLVSDSFKIWFNVSIHQLKMGFVSQLMNQLDAFGLDPKSFFIEIQESALINNVDSHLDDLLQLKSLGFGVSIDSFGSDLGCLKLITEGHCDYIKIDKKIVSDICSEKSKENFVRCLANIANHANVGVIAIGVESQSQGEALLNCGCKLAQGYFYSKPMKPEHVYFKVMGG